MSELLDQIYQAEIKFTQAQEELARLRALVSPEVVDDYAFPILGGRTLGLSELFGGGQDLILVHNMGRKCPSCTMWADEYNGVLQHPEGIRRESYTHRVALLVSHMSKRLLNN